MTIIPPLPVLSSSDTRTLLFAMAFFGCIVREIFRAMILFRHPSTMIATIINTVIPADLNGGSPDALQLE